MAALLPYVRVLHVVGIILWIGGIIAVGFIAWGVPDEARKETAIAARRVVKVLVTPGMGLAWVAGLTMLFTGWSAVYSHAGWMHGKLLGALIATGLTGVMTGRVRKAAGGEVERLRPLRTLALVILVVAIAVVALAVLQP